MATTTIRRYLNDATTTTREPVPPPDVKEWIMNANQDILAIATLGLGPLFCFWGGKLFRLCFACMGFVVSGWCTYFLCDYYRNDAGFSDVTIGVLSVVAALIGMALFWFLFRVGIFAIGATGACIGASFLWRWIASNYETPDSPAVYIVFMVVFGIIGGVLAHYLADYIIKPITAFVGAFFITIGVGYFYKRFSSGEKTQDVLDIVSFFSKPDSIVDCTDAYCITMFVIWILFTVVGTLYQVYMHPVESDEDETEYKGTSYQNFNNTQLAM